MLRRGVSTAIPLRRTNGPRVEVINDLKTLPTCWIREQAMLWEIFAEYDKPMWLDLDDRIRTVAMSKKKLLLGLSPVPHPANPNWHRHTGGPWKEWWRPDFRLWGASRERAQDIIDHAVNLWRQLGGSPSGLRFEWFNEPARGHVGGPSEASGQAVGTWDTAFHSFCNYMLVDEGHLNFHGHTVQGSTLSFWGEPGPEAVELRTCVGGDDGQWWTRMNRRCANISHYYRGQVRRPEEYAKQYGEALESMIGKISALPIPTTSKQICIHEWYVTKPMLGYHKGECSDTLRAECIIAAGEEIARHSEIEMAFFFTHFFPDEANVSEYEKYSAYRGVGRKALERYLRGKP